MTETTIHQAVVGVFKKFGFGPFDIEAIISFALRDFDVTPFNYIECHEKIMKHITSHFECRRGSLKDVQQLSLSRTLVYYRE